MKQSANTIRLLGQELWRRIYRPFMQVTFWSFLILGIVFFGGLAIWIEVLKYIVADHKSIEGIRLAILTYYPAVGCAAGRQIAIYEEKRGYLREFGNASSIGLMVVCATSFFLQDKYPVGVLVCGVFLSFVAVFLAWVAVGLDQPFDEPDPDVTVGGDPTAALSGDSGGFQL
jgi:hypothetical protein